MTTETHTDKYEAMRKRVSDTIREAMASPNGIDRDNHPVKLLVESLSEEERETLINAYEIRSPYHDPSRDRRHMEQIDNDPEIRIMKTLRIKDIVEVSYNWPSTPFSDRRGTDRTKEDLLFHVKTVGAPGSLVSHIFLTMEGMRILAAEKYFATEHRRTETGQLL